MKIFDMHVHANNKITDKEKLILNMNEAGVYGCCVFSACPCEYDENEGISFEERLNEVFSIQKGYEDRIFPVLWIHPYEENIIENIHIAVDKGICGFKIICSDFYVYEEQCIRVLTEIASLGKPVFFHSGILWDGQISSSYNRPLNWEALLHIKGLRFSMGHCSWPWIDECIALYGKFLNSLLKGDTAEMFFDLTPGTPEIYREELFTKLFDIGYDVGNNIMFGTDSNADEYSSDWTSFWLKTDNLIMDKLGVSGEIRNKIYYDNLLRFLGKTHVKIEHISPETDDSHKWTPVNPDVVKIIRKWYNTLEFPKEFDAEFEQALETIKIADIITIENYIPGENGKRNLLSFLYMCEALELRYKEKNIPVEILIDTLKDIVIWNNIWSDLKNELYLGECKWLSNHLSGKLFKLGRLQFCMGKAEIDMSDEGIKKGDNVIEVHIPECGPLNIEDCAKSIEWAKKFFKEYFPEFKYKCFTCHSWLLDDSLKEILKPESNILAFQNMFDIKEKEESDAILKYVFRWNTTRRKLAKEFAASSFAVNVKARALRGGKFYENLGILKNSKY